MKTGVENKMYKRDNHYNVKLSKSDLEREISRHYTGEDGLVIQLMSNAVQDNLVETLHELAVANESLWGLNDWPEGQGFGSSDRFEYIRRIKESIAFERSFLQAEDELIAINKLDKCPLNDTVRAFMKMNEKLAEGLGA
jgi:hypothetical protein